MTTVQGVSYRVESVTISSSGTISTAVQIDTHSLVGIIMPSAFTGTQISFQTSIDGVTYQALNNTSGAAVACTVAASKNIGIVPTDFTGWPYIKLVSNASEGSSRTIQLLTRQCQ